MKKLKNLRTWIYVMIYVGIFVAVAFLCVAATQPGDTILARLNNAYQWLVTRTTGRQYTDLMRWVACPLPPCAAGAEVWQASKH
jgi:hypothetical protein